MEPMMEQTAEPLRSASTLALLEELFRRYEAAAFVGRTRRAAVGGVAQDWQEWMTTQGDERVLQGLCAGMIRRCEDQLMKRKLTET